jgi:hypothetical protein
MRPEIDERPGDWIHRTVHGIRYCAVCGDPQTPTSGPSGTEIILGYGGGLDGLFICRPCAVFPPADVVEIRAWLDVGE